VLEEISKPYLKQTFAHGPKLAASLSSCTIQKTRSFLKGIFPEWTTFAHDLHFAGSNGNSTNLSPEKNGIKKSGRFSSPDFFWWAILGSNQ